MNMAGTARRVPGGRVCYDVAGGVWPVKSRMVLHGTFWLAGWVVFWSCPAWLVSDVQVWLVLECWDGSVSARLAWYVTVWSGVDRKGELNKAWVKRTAALLPGRRFQFRRHCQAKKLAPWGSVGDTYLS